MANTPVHTQDAPPPFSAYSQAIAARAGARIVHVSGQVGAGPDGTLAKDAQGQHAQCWANVLAILAEAGMGREDIVSVNAYVTDPSGIALYRTERDKALGGALHASTLVIVAGLADPAWVVEIQAVAAKVD